MTEKIKVLRVMNLYDLRERLRSESDVHHMEARQQVECAIVKEKEACRNDYYARTNTLAGALHVAFQVRG